MIFTIHHRKGGVGKTTTTQHLSSATAAAGFKSLAIDTDGQGNLTNALTGKRPSEFSGHAIGDLVKAVIAGTIAESLWNACVLKISDTLSLIPSSGIGTDEANDSIANYGGLRGNILRLLLREHGYQCVWIDTSPGDTWLTKNALLAADRIIAPVACETFSADGLHELARTLQQLGIINRENGQPLSLYRIVPTLFNHSRKAHKMLLEEMRKTFNGTVTQTTIGQDSAIESAQNVAQSVFQYNPKARSAGEYIELAKELIA